MSIRWLLGVAFMFILLTIVSNTLEKQDLLSTGQVSELQAMTEQQFTESKEPDVGGLTTTGMNPLAALKLIGKMLFFDYSFFYDVDYTMTEGECDATDGGVWQDATSSCRTPSDWMIIRYILFFPITIAMLFFIGLTIWHAIRG